MTGNPVPSGDSRKADGSNDLTSEGNADTTAVAGAAGTDITASTEYGSKNSPDGAEDVRHFTWHMLALSSTVQQSCIWGLQELYTSPGPMLLNFKNIHVLPHRDLTLAPACQWKAGNIAQSYEAHNIGCPDVPLPEPLRLPPDLKRHQLVMESVVAPVAGPMHH